MPQPPEEKCASAGTGCIYIPPPPKEKCASASGCIYIPPPPKEKCASASGSAPNPPRELTPQDTVEEWQKRQWEETLRQSLLPSMRKLKWWALSSQTFCRYMLRHNG